MKLKNREDTKSINHVSILDIFGKAVRSGREDVVFFFFFQELLNPFYPETTAKVINP